MALGYPVGMPVAVVGASPSAEVELGSTMMVVGNHGCELVTVVIGGMLVTPGPVRLLLLLLLVEVLNVGITVGGSDVVSGGTVTF